MVELLTVIGIIVLMLAVAVPVVRSIQGNRTVEVGYNTISAALGHARQIALYYRAPAGVVFYQDPATKYQAIGYVMQERNIPQDAAFPSQDDRYFDLIPNEQVITLPQGLAVQVFNGNGAPLTGATPPYEKYLRVGIVIFDENGELANLPYWIRQVGTFIPVQYHLGDPNHLNLAGNFDPPNPPPSGGTAPPALYGHSAVCLYDDESYLGQVVPADSTQFNDTNNASSVNYSGYFTGGVAAIAADKIAEQNWLDQNGEVLVIRPNDGSLLRNK